MKKAWRVLLLLAVPAFGQDPEPAPAPPPAAEPSAPAEPVPAAGSADVLSVPEAPALRPRWLERAERTYMEGLKAQQGGDDRLARRKFGAALKTIAENADESAMLGLKDEIVALFAKLEERILPPPERPAPPPEPALEVTEKELEVAPPAEPPAEAEKKTYAVPVDPDDPLVRKYLAVYTGAKKQKMQEALDRMALYRPMILKRLEEEGLPRELLYLPLVESEYQNGAVSRAGAVGLWQFMSATGRYCGLKINYWLDERRDPEKATRAAVRTLKDLHAWFDDWHLALAAYNRGVYGIQRDMEATRSPDFARLSQRRGLPEETEHYVPKLMATILLADNAEAYGFRIAPDADASGRPDEVTLDKPLDLAVAAKCAGVPEKTIRELNPSLRLWCTPKNDAAFTLRVPAGSKRKFKDALEKVKDWTPTAETVKHKVKKGEFLGLIAKIYRTTISAIQKDNRIANPKRLKPGQVLVIRPGRPQKTEKK